MKELYIYLGIFALAAIFLAVREYFSRKKNKEDLRRNIKKAWGNVSDREYEPQEFENITQYFNLSEKPEYYVDDITWNDLNMDNIFMIINNTYSSLGEEYLYKMLREPKFNNDDLAENESIVEFFEKNPEIAYKYQEMYSALGRTKKLSFYEFLHSLKDLGKRSNINHYVALLAIIASIIVTIVNPPVGIFITLIVVGSNIISYFFAKSEVEAYFLCFKYIACMLALSDKITSENESKSLENILSNIAKHRDELKSIRRGMFLISGNDMSGSITDVIMDYVRMIFHVDLIKFNSMLNMVNDKIEMLEALYSELGRLEADMAVASFRKMLPYYCVPEFSESKKSTIYFDEIYHPSIEDAIANDINEDKCVLITGSNASGKSTFLKTVAINAILAQTIKTCSANQYRANFYEIYSSMALRDDLSSNESYYIVEIKSLKRIIDRVSEERHILCFVDEVLRGTNTIERISASAHILKNLSERNVMCFAATHDIELTHILEDYYSNYHFQEEVEDNDIIFNYKLYEGEATSRNAIKLLGIMGYNEKIINAAEKTASDFLKNGNWTKCY